MKSKMERFRAGLFGKITPFIIFLFNKRIQMLLKELSIQTKALILQK